MSWLAELAGKAENILENLDEQTGIALRNNNATKKKEYGLHKDPPWVQPQQKKKPRQLKSRKSLVTETKSSPSPSRNTSPYNNYSQSTAIENNYTINEIKKAPVKKLSRHTYNLENCPKTLLADYRNSGCEDEIVRKRNRRHSYPNDVEPTKSVYMLDSIQKMQNLEVENVMLRNELNVLNGEISELVEKLHRVEDDLSKTTLKLENCEILNHTVNLDKASLFVKLDQLKHNITESELQKYLNNYDDMQSQLSELKDTNNDLEHKLQILNDKLKEVETKSKNKESEYRHAQVTTESIQDELEKSQNECKQQQRDWEAYRLRVKSMLRAKDTEIKELKQGLVKTKNEKLLVEEIETLKTERQELSESIKCVRSVYEALKLSMGQLETRHESAGRVVEALRDVLQGEWEARNRAEAQCASLTKELNAVHLDTGQTITNLRLALHDKETDLNRLREKTSLSAQTSDTGALNVADYDTQESIHNEKIHYLTQMLVQKQERLDTLLAEKNTMRIHFDKLENKYKAEISSLRAHSVVQLSADRPRRSRASPLPAAAAWLALYCKRNPVFRLFIIVYMISLHLWIMTLLLSKVPEGYLPQH